MGSRRQGDRMTDLGAAEIQAIEPPAVVASTRAANPLIDGPIQIGRASCRERVYVYV